jgi:CxxC-x17-CxxC domain-containing protein
MAFQDQTLTCRDCGKDFVWTASEQEFYQSKGFQNAPVRCPADRAAKKVRMDGRGPRQMHDITCANCGKHDSVPFEPRGDRPVLCGDCFRKQRDGGLPEVESKKANEEVSEENNESQEEDSSK